MCFSDNAQVLNEAASVTLVSIDVLVDGLMAESERAAQAKRVGDLFGAPIKFQQSNDCGPELRIQAETTTLTLTAQPGMSVSQSGTVSAITRLSIAGELSADSTGGALEIAGDCRVSGGASPQEGNGVAFSLREL